MPTINVPNGNGKTGSNNTYPNTVGTEGTGISYTLNIVTSQTYWIISSVINCTVSSYWGTDNATITVTPTNQVPAINFWGFNAQEWQGTGSPSGEPAPDIGYNGEFIQRLSTGYPLSFGNSTVSGPFIRSAVTDPTYGLRIFNSSGNLTLDLSSIYPEIYAAGSAGTIAANGEATITISGVVANGGFVPIPIGSNPGNTLSLYSWVSATNQIKIKNFNFNTAIAASYVVMRL